MIIIFKICFEAFIDRKVDFTGNGEREMGSDTQQGSLGSGFEPAKCFQASEPVWYAPGP